MKRDDLLQPLHVRRLGVRDYATVLAEMQAFTAARTVDTPDELWSVEHPSVFTQGMAGKPAHVLTPGTIPVVQADRGGQVTYHGPGQVVVYCLLDVRRLGMSVRGLVTALEQSVITLLARYGIVGTARPDAPGVYVGDAKIAALGLRIRQGRCYHGVSLNVEMDLEPFTRINPCGYPGLAVTQLRDLGVQTTPQAVAEQLLQHLGQQFGYPSFISPLSQIPPASEASLSGGVLSFP